MAYEGAGKLLCGRCGVHCSSHGDAEKHLSGSHNARSWHYVCSRCGKNYERLSQVSCHFPRCTSHLQAANGKSMITSTSTEKKNETNQNVVNPEPELTGTSAILTTGVGITDPDAVAYEGAGKLLCGRCGVHCSSHGDAERHLSGSHNARSWHYVCSRCGRNYERLSQVSCHFP